MLSQVGDIWEIEAAARCVLTNLVVKNNGTLVMGAGNAKQALDRYPSLDVSFGAFVSAGSRVFEVLATNGNFQIAGDILICLPTKLHYRKPAELDLVVESLMSLVELANSSTYTRAKQYETGLPILLPRPGCGLGGLDWDKTVEPICAELLDDRFMVVSYD